MRRLELDILKLVVVNRYYQAPPAIAFIKNFGLKRGAMASSVAHDSHNVIAVGASDEDIAAAINLVMDAGGGLSAACAAEKSGRSAAATGCRTDGHRHLRRSRPRLREARQAREEPGARRCEHRI